MISISVVGGIEFWLYIHGEREEFFLHYDYWPSVPKIHHIRKPEVSTDFVIKSRQRFQMKIVIGPKSTRILVIVLCNRL